ncbi:hypothetical protein DLAC_08535 [Tieghemostelium lacteum]|uniref:Uncharacterized protein n=1 Tax=Tieghemostelium lacteum TaxID=361077 RepID=A0A151Z7Q7_TIELA|nr:hypothetical protein DLAC_08535 [Tieghemostelium lacteum]|eukprot:KYQ89965.1 hypothetical protein DLAC_08535 [Tieghemostelium lacteum]
MVLILNGSILKNSEFPIDSLKINNNNNQNINSQSENTNILSRLLDIFGKPIKNENLGLFVDSLEMSTLVYNISLKLKYLIAICFSSAILFGSVGLLSCLLCVYLGTLYSNSSTLLSNNNNNEINSNHNSNNGIQLNSKDNLSSSTSSQFINLQNNLIQSSNILSTKSYLNSSTQNIFTNSNDDSDEEESKPVFHLCNPNLRKSSPSLNTFSPNTGRKLGSS